MVLEQDTESAEGEALLLAAQMHPTAFAAVTKRGYLPADFHFKIGDALLDVAEGRCDRLILTMPPRHGKSELVSVRFPAWYLGRYPDRRIIAASYGIDLAEDFGRKAKNVINESAYRAIFPHVALARDSSAASRWNLDGYDGGYIAAGVGGPITGRGANCLAGDTLILTDTGPIDIATLVRTNYRGRVLSFNHATGRPEWRVVEAVRETVADAVVELTTSGGRTLRATSNHRIYTDQRGYRPAGVLQAGAGLVTAPFASQQDVRAVWQAQERTWGVVPAVLSGSTEGKGRAALRAVRHGVRATALRVREDASARPQRRVLFVRLFTGRSRRQMAQAVPGVRDAEARAQQQILLARLPAGRYQAQTPQRYLWSVRHLLRAVQQSYAILQPDVREQGLLTANGGRGQFALQGSAQLCRMVPTDAAGDHGARPPSLCGVRQTGRAASGQVAGQRDHALAIHDSPRQRGRAEQYDGESGDALWRLPHCPPQVERDTVSGTRQLRTPGIRVYDLQVEGNRNFFANGVLVHNCLIIDDPIKNREEANSQTIRESIWNWFTSTAFTRQESPFACIIIMTRWHEHDLVGRLLEESEAGGDRWRVVNFPAIDDDGLPLWPEKYDIDALQRIRRVVGTRDWSALYQQSPSPVEGGLLKRHWWRYWAAPDRAGSLTPRRFKLEDGREVVQHTVARPELAEFDELIQSWDLAFKDTKDSSFVVGQVWGRKGPDRYLLSQIRGKWDYNATLKRIRAYSKAWPEAQGKLIEDKANGPAVIASLRSVIPGIIPVPVRADKEGRVNAVLPVVEAGNVYIPHPAQASWVDDFIDECAKFPNTTYKDQVDAMTQALARWQGRVAMDTIDRAAARRVRQRYRGFSIPRW